jgi:signal transduction histidine kinase
MAAMPAVLKTTAARLSGLYLLLFALCATALVFYVTSLSGRMLISQTQDSVVEEMQQLGRAYQRGGLTLLVRFVEQRSRQPGANLYLIADPNGRILSGNVASLEPGVLEIDGWTQRPFGYQRFGLGDVQREAFDQQVDEGGLISELPVHRAVAIVLRLPNQMILLVGRDLGEPEQFQHIVRQALMVAFLVMGLGALAIWLIVGRRALKRIDSISEAGRRIMGGDLAGRLPVTGSGDEFDRLSENLNVMLARIARLNEGLREVSDNVAHDLKTPLTRLRNRAEAALSPRSGPEDHRRALEATIAESDQLIRTFNAILMISRLEAGSSSEQRQRVDLAAIVRDVVELYEAVAEEIGVELTVGEIQAIEMDGNRELIGQALSNIVDNAIKYSVDADGKPRVTVSLKRVPGRIVLEVVDNGPGIPEEDRQRAMERFVRLERSRTKPGSGLGLSLARAVMTFHGGSLELGDGVPGLKVDMVFPGERAKDEHQP